VQRSLGVLIGGFRGGIVQFKNDMSSYDALFNTVSSFYQAIPGRRVVIFETQFPGEDLGEDYFVRYLLDAKHAVEYRIERDRNFLLSVLSLAIGPHYFPPCDFWDYENSQRFKLEASTEAVVHNLTVLDEFLHR
jgi:hypothetical protein